MAAHFVSCDKRRFGCGKGFLSQINSMETRQVFRLPFLPLFDSVHLFSIPSSILYNCHRITDTSKVFNLCGKISPKSDNISRFAVKSAFFCRKPWNVCLRPSPNRHFYRKPWKIVLSNAMPYRKACKIILPSAKPYRKPCNIFLHPYQTCDFVNRTWVLLNQ